MIDFELRVINDLAEVKTNMVNVKEDIAALKKNYTPCEKENIKKDIQEKTKSNRKLIYMLLAAYFSLTAASATYTMFFGNMEEVKHGVHKQK